MTSKISPTIKLRGRTVDTGLHSPRSKSASVPATAEYIITSDKKKFLNSPFGRANANRHERSLEKLSSPSSVDSAHPVEPANLFGSAGSPSAGSSAESDELRARETELIRAAELTDKEAFLDQKLAEIQSREDDLEALVRKSVEEVLQEIKFKEIADEAVADVGGIGATRLDEAADDAALFGSDDGNRSFLSFSISQICAEENVMSRLIARFRLPEEFRSEKNEVHSVTDFYLRSVKKYDRLKTVFDSNPQGADLILAVHRFRELMISYKDTLSDQLLDALTIVALAHQSDQLGDKVNDSLSVACGVLTSGRKTVFDQMMISGVLPEAIGPSDILRSLGARELFAPSGAQALKSVRQFVVSYCGYFDDILVKAQEAGFAHATMVFDESMDLQARFSAEKRSFNSAVMWFDDEFIRPLKRAQLFLSKLPGYVKLKFAEDKDLPVTITWDQFKRDVSEVWVAAVKKQRMMQGMGLLTPAIIEEKCSESAMSASPQDSPDSEKMVKIMCRTVACGMFEYPASKIEWLKEKFKDDYHPPARCVKCKAEHDKLRNNSSFNTELEDNGEQTAAPAEEPLSPPAPVPKNRFGTRRTPQQ